jgi:hypothetical protein
MKTFYFISFLILTGCADEAKNVFSNSGGGGMGGEGGTFEETGGGGTGGTLSNGGGGMGGETSEGGGGSSSTGTCTPKTCATVAVELNGGTSGNPESCGLVSDGCGNFMDCGECSNPHQGCGVGSYEVPNLTDEKSEGIPNLCGGNCALIFNQDVFFSCQNQKKGWFCSVPTSTPPSSNCESATLQLPSAIWCC